MGNERKLAKRYRWEDQRCGLVIAAITRMPVNARPACLTAHASLRASIRAAFGVGKSNRHKVNHCHSRVPFGRAGMAGLPKATNGIGSPSARLQHKIKSHFDLVFLGN